MRDTTRFRAKDVFPMNASLPLLPAILIIDDHVSMRQNLEELLTFVGYRVLLAASAQEGLHRLHTAEIGLVITDLRLPDTTGWQLFQQVHAQPRWRHLPFVFFSGDAEQLDAIVAQREPEVVACLPKPFDIQALFEAVARALQAAGAP
jgi:CheY-like chemotaxis protein